MMKDMTVRETITTRGLFPWDDTLTQFGTTLKYIMYAAIFIAIIFALKSFLSWRSDSSRNKLQELSVVSEILK